MWMVNPEVTFRWDLWRFTMSYALWLVKQIYLFICQWKDANLYMVYMVAYNNGNNNAKN